MSTDKQEFSPKDQAEAIRAYAVSRNIQIVREYADEGRSGPNADNRDALQRLLADVEGGSADFDAILV